MYDPKLSNRGAHALAKDERALRVCGGEQRDELFASVAGGTVDAAQGVRERVRDGGEHAIAFEVAVSIVILFEMIDVEHQHGVRRERSGGVFPLGGKGAL